MPWPVRRRGDPLGGRQPYGGQVAPLATAVDACLLVCGMTGNLRSDVGVGQRVA